MIKAVSTFVKNSSFNLISDLSTKISKTLIIILISHTLGVSTMGQFSIALTFLGFGFLFSNWGFGNLLIREVSRDRNLTNKYLSNYAIIRFVFVVITFLIINIISRLFNYSSETLLIIRIVTLGLFASTFINLLYSLFVAHESLKSFSLLLFISSFLRLLLSAIILFTNGTIIQIAILYTAIDFVTLIIIVIIAIRCIPNFKPEINFKFAFSQILRAFPFFWIGMLMMLDTRAEILILSYFSNEAIVGYYTAVNTILGGVTVFSEAIRNTIYPIIARYQREAESKLKEMTLLFGKFVLIITIPVSIGIFFLSKEIVFFFFKEDYLLSVTMLRITIWLSISYSLTIFLTALLISHDKEKKVAFALFVSGVTSLVLNLLMAYFVGVVGVAVVRVSTSFLMFGLLLYFHYEITGYGIIKAKVCLLSCCCALAMFITGFVLHSYNPWLAVSVSMLVYILLLYFTGTIKTEDLNLVRQLFNEIIGKNPGK